MCFFSSGRMIKKNLEKQSTHTYIHYITLHYITLHYIALHCIALHCITLHYIICMHTYIHYLGTQITQYFVFFVIRLPLFFFCWVMTVMHVVRVDVAIYLFCFRYVGMDFCSTKCSNTMALLWLWHRNQGHTWPYMAVYMSKKIGHPEMAVSTWMSQEDSKWLVHWL